MVDLPKTTRAAVLYRPNENLAVEALEIPKLQAGQVLVKMAYAGVCQTQLLEVRGRKGPDPYLPHTLGHEGSGQVLAIGPAVTEVREGDRVALSWIKGPGANAPAPKYRNARGETVNAGQVATFTQYAVVSENRCTRIPESLALDVAVLLGCAVPTGAGIVLNQLDAKPGQSIAVIGVGGIGLSAVLAAKMAGCFPIIAIDVDAAKLAFAQELGATHGINAKAQDVVESVNGILKGGVDFAIEASGAKDAMEAGFRIVRVQGGRLIIAGNLAHGEKISLDPFDLIRGKQIVGTVGGQTRPDRDLPLYARLQIEGKFRFEKLISRVFKLEEINQVFSDLERGVLGRLLINF